MVFSQVPARRDTTLSLTAAFVFAAVVWVVVFSLAPSAATIAAREAALQEASAKDHLEWVLDNTAAAAEALRRGRLGVALEDIDAAILFMQHVSDTPTQQALLSRADRVYGDIQLVKGDRQDAKRRYTAAVAAARAALSASPKDRSRRILLAAALQKVGGYDEQLAIEQSIIDEGGEKANDLYGDLVELHARSRRWREAIAAEERMPDLPKQSAANRAGVHLYAAVAHAFQHEPEEMQRELAEARRALGELGKDGLGWDFLTLNPPFAEDERGPGHCAAALLREADLATRAPEDFKKLALALDGFAGCVK